MHTDMTIGLVVPNATNEVSPEGLKLYPDVRFVARGVGVKGLSAEGFQESWNAIVPAAEQLAAAGVDAIMLMGTSLTFHRGFEAHERLVEQVRSLTGLPVSTMSTALVDGLRQLGVTRVGVATAYSDEVNQRLHEFLVAHGIDVLALQGFGLVGFAAPGRKTPEDIMALASDVLGEAAAAESLVISCGGLRTLELIAPLEAEHGVAVVSSTPAAYWAAVRLAGLNSAVPGYGRLLAAQAPVRTA
jgi:arylmalonate decarboxylase